MGIKTLRDAALNYMCASTKRLADVQITDAFARLGEQRPKLALEIMAKMVAPSTRKRLAEPVALPEDLNSITVAQLKQHCNERGLATTGNKQALIDRLRQNAT